MIKNDSNHDFFYAPYYVLRKKALRAAPPQQINQTESLLLTVPRGRPFFKRTLVIAQNEEQLSQKIDADNLILDSSNSTSIGLGSTSRFTITSSPKHGTLLQPADGKEAIRIRDGLRRSIEQRSPHHAKKATVTIRKDHISDEERSYLNKRQKVINTAFQKYLGRDLNSACIPRISICASGGGVRAMLMTLGALKGLQEIGLLDTARYMTGVSGGTWAITLWIAWQKSIEQQIERLSTHLETIPSKRILIKESLNEASSLNQVKALFGHRTGLTDIFSLCLSRVLLVPFEENFRQLKWSEIHKSLHPAQHPFPVCTAVSPSIQSFTKYDWVEFTPYEIRLAVNDACVPTWAFMRRFKDGVSTDAMPEPWLGYIMGIWGSAFSISFADVITKAKPLYQTILPSIFIEKITSQNWGAQKRFAARIPNFSYGMPRSMPGTERPLLKMIDAGHSNNIGIAPLMHAGRDQDLLIIINAGTKPRLDLQWMYDMRKKLKQRYGDFEFDVDKAASTPVTFWPAKIPGQPDIIHIALHPDKHFDANYNPRTDRSTKTLNFTYSHEKVRKLTDLTEFVVKKNAPLFREAVEHSIIKKKAAMNPAKRWFEKVKGWFSS